MLPDRVSNPGPLTYESGVLPIALRGPAVYNSSNDSTFELHRIRYWYRFIMKINMDRCNKSTLPVNAENIDDLCRIRTQDLDNSA